MKLCNSDGEGQSMDLEALLKTHRDQILEAAHKHGAFDVRVFGSVARGDACPDSDIDFLVRLESGRSLMDLARLLRELQALLGCKVEIVTEAGLRQRIRAQVLREARPL
jgi:predicted nucleotidyltransferase